MLLFITFAAQKPPSASALLGGERMSCSLAGEAILPVCESAKGREMRRAFFQTYNSEILSPKPFEEREPSMSCSLAGEAILPVCESAKGREMRRLSFLKLQASALFPTPQAASRRPFPAPETSARTRSAPSGTPSRPSDCHSPP